MDTDKVTDADELRLRVAELERENGQLSQRADQARILLERSKNYLGTILGFSELRDEWLADTNRQTSDLAQSRAALEKRLKEAEGLLIQARRFLELGSETERKIRTFLLPQDLLSPVNQSETLEKLKLTRCEYPGCTELIDWELVWRKKEGKFCHKHMVKTSVNAGGKA